MMSKVFSFPCSRISMNLVSICVCFHESNNDDEKKLVSCNKLVYKKRENQY